MSIHMQHIPAVLLALTLVSCAHNPPAPTKASRSADASLVAATQPVPSPRIVRDESGEPVHATLHGRVITDADCEALSRMQSCVA